MDNIDACSQITSRNVALLLEDHISIIEILFRRELIKQDIYDILNERNLVFSLRKSKALLSDGEKILVAEIIHEIGSLSEGSDQLSKDLQSLRIRLQSHGYLLQ